MAKMFQKCQISGLHQAKKTTNKIDETTKIGLRTGQHIIKIWKESGEPWSQFFFE